MLHFLDVLRTLKKCQVLLKRRYRDDLLYFILDCQSKDAWIMLGNAYVHRCNLVALQLQARSYLPTAVA